MPTALTLIGRTRSKAAIASSPRSVWGSASRRVTSWKRSRDERVDRDVDAVDAGLDQRRRVALEQVAVGRHREVLDPLDRAQHRHQLREVAAGERLAAGEADVGDAEPGEQRHQPLDLLEAQDLVAIEPFHPLGRHAVATAEVAAIGDRDAQVGDRPAVGVGQLLDDCLRTASIPKDCGSASNDRDYVRSQCEHMFVTYPDYIHEKAREMRARKMTLDEISERLAIGKPTVWNWIKDMPKPPQTARQKAAQLRAGEDGD